MVFVVPFNSNHSAILGFVLWMGKVDMWVHVCPVGNRMHSQTAGLVQGGALDMLRRTGQVQDLPMGSQAEGLNQKVAMRHSELEQGEPTASGRASPVSPQQSPQHTKILSHSS